MRITTEPEAAPIVTQGQVEGLANELKISRKTATGQLAREQLHIWVPAAIRVACAQKDHEREQRPTTSRDLKKVRGLIGTIRALEKYLTNEEDRQLILRNLRLQERLKLAVLAVDPADRERQLAEGYQSVEDTVRVILDCAGTVRASLEDVACNLPVIASVATAPGNRSKVWLHELTRICLDYHAEFLEPLKLKPRVTMEAFARAMISLARTVLHDNPAKDGSADYLKAARKARGR